MRTKNINENKKYKRVKKDKTRSKRKTRRPKGGLGESISKWMGFSNKPDETNKTDEITHFWRKIYDPTLTNKFNDKKCKHPLRDDKVICNELERQIAEQNKLIEKYELERQILP